MHEAQTEWAGARVLVVDDDATVLRSMQRTLERLHFVVVCADSGEEARQQALTHDIDVALLDLTLPDTTGNELMGELKQHDPTIQCIIFTGHTSLPAAADAYDAGAVEYFEKPITDWRRFETALIRAVLMRRRTRERAAVPGPTEDAAGADTALRRMVAGGSKAMEDIRRTVLQIAARSTTLLFSGPSGSGKTLLAEAAHRISGRTGMLEIVNCGALHGPGMYGELFGRQEGNGPEGRRPGAFERAANGTLVLDEIADLPLDLQGNLLTALDGRGFVPAGGGPTILSSARVIVTSHEDIDQLVRAGRFREDLFHRLGIRVRLPGLNERREDIPQLVYQFLRRIHQQEGLDIRRVPADVLAALVEHDWSASNVRGLRTAVEQAAIFSRGDALSVDALPSDIVDGLRAPKPPVAAAEPLVTDSARLPDTYRNLSYQQFKERLLNDFMGAYLRGLLESTEGNVTRAARLAGLHRPNFRRLMKRYGVETHVLADEDDDET